MGYSLKRNRPGLPLGPLFAAEQSQPRRGGVAEHWASLGYACLPVCIGRLMHLQ